MIAMIRKIVSFVLMSLLVTTMFAQGDLSGMSREQFRKYKENYIKTELNLNEALCRKFFPLYQEYQDKKQKIYSENQALMERANIASEAEYRTIIERLQELGEASDRLEKEYFQKFKGILTYEQLFKLNKAESNFQKHLFKELSKRKNNSGRR